MKSIHSTWLALTLSFAPLLLLLSCGDDAEREEVVNKLRTLGVAQSPVNAKPGDTVQLTYYLAGPKAMTLTAKPKLDNQAKYSVPVLATAVDSAVTETNYGNLSVYSFRASIAIPTTPTLVGQITATGSGRVRSQLQFTATNQDEEDIVTDTLIYAAGSSQLSWSPQTIQITKPTSDGKSGTLDLEGSITSTNEENNRVTWFVSAGSVKNRRAKITSWQDVPSGEQTLIMTVQGSKSGSFAIIPKKVVVTGS